MVYKRIEEILYTMTAKYSILRSALIKRAIIPTNDKTIPTVWDIALNNSSALE
jgi:hypothetical protein